MEGSPTMAQTVVACLAHGLQDEKGAEWGGELLTHLFGWPQRLLVNLSGLSQFLCHLHQAIENVVPMSKQCIFQLMKSPKS